ncbi:hypothetical protein [Chitinophaga rhizophila]|uniref:AraC family transcriptional regulator n=1 Tax=Chitinophaga rhizophila TaxID=2866212 RepID=A0ABS7G7A7_9BACT|nr:hypothetical protein [Chitinophaga rhizophila]MBW8683331.1 hypothetical protein [Chitinophaga rhizophila]
MTVNEIYTILYSKSYYEKSGQHKFRFLNSSLFVDRRANVPFVIHMLDGIFYLQALQEIANESLFRIEMNGDEIMLHRLHDETVHFTLV